MNIIFIYIMIFLSAMISARVSYQNFTLYQIKLVRSKDVTFFRAACLNNTFGWIFWTEHITTDWPISIVISPGGRNEFETTLMGHNIHYKVTIDDLEREFLKQEAMEYDRRNLASFDWNDYNTLDGINDWLMEIQKQYKNVSSIVNVGETYENRTIRGIRIANNLDVVRPVVVIEAGIHAREWISVSVATFLIRQLLDKKTSGTILARRKYDFYIFPILNPDGYHYTHTTDRMWRKNRKPYPPSIGVDLNRNFDIEWMDKGSSDVSKSEMYAGPHAFSEPETKSYSETLLKIGSRIHIYISLHSYGQLMMIPPIYTSTPDKHFSRAKIMGLAATKALTKRFGTKYRVGSASNILYMVSGSSVDWVKVKLGTPLAFVYELRDTGGHGFALPKDQILPTCLETTDSIMSLVNYETQYPRREIVFPVMNSVGTVSPLVPSYVLILLTLHIL